MCTVCVQAGDTRQQQCVAVCGTVQHMGRRVAQKGHQKVGLNPHTHTRAALPTLPVTPHSHAKKEPVM